MLDKPGLTGASPLSPGDVVANRYQIIEELGRGGYAIVYKATDRTNGNVIALKTIRPIAPRPDEVRERFRREAELVSRLNHPNTVRVFDAGYDNEFYLALEYLQGYALSEILDGVRGISPRRAIAITCGVLESLTEAHALGIVHRDLKPENIFLVQRPDGGETVKVLDFGIAKVIHDDDKMPSLTLKGRAMGTPTYMSPEQAKGGKLTIHSDIYSVAVLIYEMLCGVPPFQGDNAMDIMLKHVNEKPPGLSLPALRGSIIDVAVQKALAKPPDARFPSAWAFLAALGGPAVRVRGSAAMPAILPPDESGRPAPRSHSPGLDTGSAAAETQPQKPTVTGLPKQNIFGSWFKKKS